MTNVLLTATLTDFTDPWMLVWLAAGLFALALLCNLIIARSSGWGWLAIKLVIAIIALVVRGLAGTIRELSSDHGVPNGNWDEE